MSESRTDPAAFTCWHCGAVHPSGTLPNDTTTGGLKERPEPALTDEREAFEKFAKSLGWRNFSRDEAGFYCVNDLAGFWRFWSGRAALSHRSTEEPAPLAWFIDADESREDHRPSWIEVEPGDVLWSDRWKRYGLFEVASPPASPSVAEEPGPT